MVALGQRQWEKEMREEKQDQGQGGARPTECPECESDMIEPNWCFHYWMCNNCGYTWDAPPFEEGD